MPAPEDPDCFSSCRKSSVTCRARSLKCAAPIAGRRDFAVAVLNSESVEGSERRDEFPVRDVDAI